ncbi:glycoside hydrolase family 3 N-terminal domain-containing protein [Leptolyngbya sp. AN02str]|uniref:glycoside hydrolase family 3 N-terminal domain-containing protein n=1 Tax=Leptolyngbya sp. AN02str TaxID=3423363 RepID=UPI003D322576
MLPSIEQLTLAQQVAQLIVVRTSGYLFDQQTRYPAWEPPIATLQQWVQELGVGGVIVLGGSAAELALKTQQMQEWATVPLLVAADVEEGVGQRFAGATWFPPPMAIGAIAQSSQMDAQQYAVEMGAAIAQESLAVGVNWLLAPVVDVNNNPLNPVINVRAWADSAWQVGELASAFVRGAQRRTVLTCAKHFPGHGDTSTDSHVELPLLNHTRDRLNAVEFPPFQAAIAAGVDSVMTAHLLIPELDPHYPATLSDRALTGILREEWGFDGLIVTDALIMGAIAQQYGANEAPVLALEAGADILLMPADPQGAIRAICDAVESGRIAPERIQASVERIWRAKHKVCQLTIVGDSSHAWETVTPAGVDAKHLTTALAQPEAIALAQSILCDSMRLHVPTAATPVAASATSALREVTRDDPTPRNVIVLDDVLNASYLGHHTPAIALPQTYGYSLHLCDRHGALQPTGDAPTLLQVFIRGNPFRSNASLIHIAEDWLHTLLAANTLQALVVYGSPYTFDMLRSQLPAEIPYVFMYGQMEQAQAIALQTLFDALTHDQTRQLTEFGF